MAAMVKPSYILGGVAFAAVGYYLYSKSKAPALTAMPSIARRVASLDTPAPAPAPAGPVPGAPGNPYCTPNGACITALQRVNNGSTMASCNGTYHLTMQADGNLVLYAGAKDLWASDTVGGAKPYLIMQEDGNAVVYDQANTVLWSTGTSGHPGALLAMQDDGNLVVYGPSQEVLWASNTAQG